MSSVDGRVKDLDLLNESRSLLHAGKLLRQPDSNSDPWNDLFVILFDNYRMFYFQYPLCSSHKGYSGDDK
jgi:hypothetical protein